MDRTPLALSTPDPVKLRPIQWVVVTPINADEVFKKIETQGNDAVVFGLTADGYQQLAVTIAELRNLIATQRSIIVKYKEYYEPVQDKK